MSPEERLMVGRVINRLVRLPEAQQDPDAVIELESLLKARPDAAYLLLQRTVLLEEALRQAQEQIEQLRAGHSTAPDTAFGRSAPAPGGAPAAAAPGYAAQAPAAPAGAPAAAAGAGGFFRNAAAIGAGVLGGNLLFQGIESLLHGGNRGGGFLSGTNAPTEIIENNYYYSDSDSNRSLPAADVNDDRGGSFLNTSDDSGPLDDFGSDDDSSMI